MAPRSLLLLVLAAAVDSAGASSSCPAAGPATAGTCNDGIAVTNLPSGGQCNCACATGVNANGMISFTVASSAACTVAACTAQNAQCGTLAPSPGPYVSWASTALPPAPAPTAAAAGSVCFIYSYPCNAAAIAANQCSIPGATYTASTGLASVVACTTGTAAANIPAGTTWAACASSNCNTAAALAAASAPSSSSASSLKAAVTLAAVGVAAAFI
jgi:hypothetical protein